MAVQSSTTRPSVSDTAQVSPRRETTTKHWTSVAVALGVIVAGLLYWSGPHNPDWRAYRILFESGGWLLKQQRDPGFLAIMLAFRTLSHDYDLFRLALGVYFVALSAGLMWYVGRRNPSGSNFYALSYVGLLPLALMLFTTQIREGIAITLVLVGLVTLQFPLAPRASGKAGIVLSVVALTAASLIHSGAVILLAALLIAIGLAAVASLFHVPARVALTGAVSLTVVVSTGLYLAGGLHSLIARYGADFYGKSLSNVTRATVPKLAYWVMTASILCYLIVKVRDVGTRAGPGAVPSLFFRYTTYAVLPVLQVLLVTLILVGYPGLVVSSAMRLYDLVLLTTLAVVSFATRKTWLLMAVVLFLIVDGQRVLVAASAP